MRTIEKFNNKSNTWDCIKFKDLKNDDIFRIFDNGERYVNKADGNNVWIAVGNPYINNDGIWSIQTIY